eukprot:COSAG05_NODE_12437_length_468_cov_0.661247_1_plen_22_part_10
MIWDNIIEVIETEGFIESRCEG